MLWDNFGTERGAYAPTLIQEQVLRICCGRSSAPVFFCSTRTSFLMPRCLPTQRPWSVFVASSVTKRPYHGTEGGPKFRRGGYGSQAEPRAAFAAMVTILDEHVGQLVAKLEQAGLADNTLIVFSSDNGPHQEAGHDPDYFNSAGGLRGYKRDLYEGGIRVPLIAQWPEVIAEGATSDHLCAQWDLFPTFAQVADAPLDRKVDGISFLPTLLGEGQQLEHGHLYWEFHEKKGRQAVRRGDWKAVRYDGFAATGLDAGVVRSGRGSNRIDERGGSAPRSGCRNGASDGRVSYGEREPEVSISRSGAAVGERGGNGGRTAAI